MKIRIHPSRYLVRALKKRRGSGYDDLPGITSLIVRQADIPEEEMRKVAALAPSIRLSLSALNEKLHLVVRFTCYKDGQLIHTFIDDKRFMHEIELIAIDGPDLSPYRDNKRMIGEWKTTVDVAFFEAVVLNRVKAQKKQEFFKRLRFQTIAARTFTVVGESVDIGLDAYGRLTEPVDPDATYDINQL